MIEKRKISSVFRIRDYTTAQAKPGAKAPDLKIIRECEAERSWCTLLGVELVPITK